jgi:DNA polymerase-1
MSSGLKAPSLYLVDAHALIFQVFHAIPGMSSPTGLPTNALFGFTRDMLFLRAEKRPDFLVCAFDVSGPTFRDEIYPEYKAHRAPMPDDLQLQIPEIYRLLEAMRIPVIAQQRFEADDVIATLATAAAAQGTDVFICTSDKDARQLIDDRIRIYNLRKHEVLDRDALVADWGIAPEQVVDLQALTGDSVDNVKGVAGIGIKTAAKLLQEYQTLDNILAAAANETGNGSGRGTKKTAVRSALTPRLAEKIRESVVAVALSRRLVRLDTDVPIPIDWETWRLRDWDADRLLALFKEWGFHRFADQVRKERTWSSQGPDVGDQRSEVRGQKPGKMGRKLEKDGEQSQRELFPPHIDDSSEEARAPAAEPFVDDWKATYHLIDTAEQFESFFDQLRQQKRFALDLETTGLEPRLAEIVGLAFSWEAGVGWYLPVRGPEGSSILDPAATLARLRPILEDTAVAKINQNIKYDMLVLRQHGVTLAGIAGDSMVADYLLHAGERSHNMEVLARTHLSHQVIPITDLIGKKGKKQLRMDQVATARVAEYSGEDADVAWRLCAVLEPQLDGALRKLYEELEVPLIEVLAELEFNGIRLDVPLLKRQGEEMGRMLAALEQDIYRLAGREFNIASLKQLRHVLFDELKLPVQRKTGITSEASTDQDTLERLAALKSHPGHELPKKIMSTPCRPW